MQASNGGVFTKLTRKQFEGFVMPDQDTETRYIYQISSTATGDFVAMMARAARVYREFDSQFSQSCLAAATLSWQFLEKSPTIVPSGGFQNPSDTFTGVYGDGDDRDERLWASVELAAATGQSKYLDYYHTHYFIKGYLDRAMSWPDLTAMAHLTYLTAKFSGKDSSVVGLLKSSLRSFCATYTRRVSDSGFQVTLLPGEFYWGSNGVVLNNAILLIAGYELFGVTMYKDAALDQLHYILGINPNGTSYVTGIGTKRPMNPHHRPSAADGVVEPAPGLLVGGPDQNRDDAILTGLYTANTPPALCYADVLASYASNEIAVNWNAPLVFVAGYFAYAPTSTEIWDEKSQSPSLFHLDQNYPNPFNGSTIIPFELHNPARVSLKIYNTLGQLVGSFVEQKRDAGKSQFQWKTDVPSGIYFYQLQVYPESGSDPPKVVETRKLVVLR